MDINDYRAGHYVQQFGYKSFSPAPINHPWLIADPEIQALLSDADRMLGELNAFAQLIPDVDFFIRMHIAKEATQSSRIEGTQTNMEEALLQEQDIDLEKRDDWREVQNYIQAINQAIDTLQTIPLSIRLLKSTHATLMQGVRGEKKQPGEFRASQNWIGASLQHAAFIPPHHEELPELMGDLEKFLHNDAVYVPHLIKIAIAHYQFETIHPFLDGNGRTGRLMIALYLANFNLLQKPALYLSDFFERHKTHYIDALTAVRQANKMREWLLFFLLGVKETAENSIQVFKEILQLKARLEREVLPRFSTRRQENARQLLQRLYQHPFASIKGTAALLDVNVNTASSLINDLVKFGVLQEATGGKRNRMFVFKAYFDKFK